MIRRLAAILVLMSAAGTAQAGYDFQGVGGTATFPGGTGPLTGTASLQRLVGSDNPLHNPADLTLANTSLTFSTNLGSPGGTLSIVGQVVGVTGVETLFTGQFTGTPQISDLGAGSISIFLGAVSGLVATDIAVYFGNEPETSLGAMTLHINGGALGTPFTNATVISTQLSLLSPSGVAIPTPASVTMLGIGLVGVGFASRRKLAIA